MSIIGIWGHSALGKTTWLHSIEHEPPVFAPDNVLVFADNSLEYHMFMGEHWMPIKKGKRWQGTKDEKLRFPLDEFFASRKVWIIESMRWFNGLQGELVAAYRRNGNTGLHMIIPWAQPQVHREFIRQRCVKVGKPMSPYWENEANCWNEARYRLNSIEKFWKPNGIPSVQYSIDPERNNWYYVTLYLKELLYAAQNSTN